MRYYFNEWRKSTLVLICKNKEDIQSYANYHGIKFMNHMMKLWGKSDKARLEVKENQFEFMTNRSTMKIIFLLRRLMKIYAKTKKSSYNIY